MKINQAVMTSFLSLIGFLYYTQLDNFSLSIQMSRHKMMN